MTTLGFGSQWCGCKSTLHRPQLVVITGGPGAGKTAVLEMAARSFCTHIGVLPEAASIVFEGGFPRHSSGAGSRAAQRAIYHVQRQVERLVVEEQEVAVGLCDRGTVDGAAYWPDGRQSYWREVGTTAEREIDRYHAVIHLETPPHERGYEQTGIRIETAKEAHEIDRRIYEAWKAHPRLISVASQSDFLSKAMAALELVRAELPGCCLGHDLPQQDAGVSTGGESK